MKNQLRNCGRALSNQKFLGLFMLIPYTAGAEVKTFFLAVNHNDRRMDIRFPTPVSVALGMTDGVTELGGFPTNITLQNRYSLTI